MTARVGYWRVSLAFATVDRTFSPVRQVWQVNPCVLESRPLRGNKKWERSRRMKAKICSTTQRRDEHVLLTEYDRVIQTNNNVFWSQPHDKWQFYFSRTSLASLRALHGAPEKKRAQAPANRISLESLPASLGELLCAECQFYVTSDMNLKSFPYTYPIFREKSMERWNCLVIKKGLFLLANTKHLKKS